MCSFLEYGSQEEAQNAVEKLSTMEIRGRRPEITIDTVCPLITLAFDSCTEFYLRM